MNDFLIYGLVDPRDGQLRYVGKSSKGLKRPAQHGVLSRLKGGSHKINWIKQLLAAGVSYSVVVIQELESIEILNQAEIFWIAYFKKMGCRLTNGTMGGDGVCDPSAEVRWKMRFGQRGKTSPWKGKTPKEAARQLMSLAKLGTKRPEEARRNIGLGHQKPIVDSLGNWYPSTKEAARILGVTPGCINGVLRGRKRRVCGRTFAYAETQSSL